MLFSIINNWFEQWIEKEHKKFKQKKRRKHQQEINKTFEKQLGLYKEFRDREINKIIENAKKGKL